jgi:monomeric isocitrate dehydrogenase
LGKQGLNLKIIEQRTGVRVQIPRIQNSSDIIYITGTRDYTTKVVQIFSKICLMNRNLSLTHFSKLISEKNGSNE